MMLMCMARARHAQVLLDMTIGGMPHQLNDQMMQFTVSRIWIIAGIWLAFFQRVSAMISE